LRKLMLLAALLAMTVMAAVPAWAQQTSGPATGVQAVDAAGAGNVCVQQVQNVNSGNVDIDQAAANVNEQVGFLQAAAAEASGQDSTAVAANVAADVNVTQTQDVTQAINQQATGIEQINTAIQICNQAFIQITGASPPPSPSPRPTPPPTPSPVPTPPPHVSPAPTAAPAPAGGGTPPPKAEAKAGAAAAPAGSPAPSPSPKAEKKAELPPTGGAASLIALGAGALLVGGGLVARRLIK
jgi:hypothetical protein